MEDVLNVNYLKEFKLTFCLLFIPVLLRIIQVFSREMCTIYKIITCALLKTQHFIPNLL